MKLSSFLPSLAEAEILQFNQPPSVLRTAARGTICQALEKHAGQGCNSARRERAPCFLVSSWTSPQSLIPQLSLLGFRMGMETAKAKETKCTKPRTHTGTEQMSSKRLRSMDKYKAPSRMGDPELEIRPGKGQGAWAVVGKTTSWEVMELLSCV
jgi:hypothetical protein